MTHTATPWRMGRAGSVVSDHPIPEISGSDDITYYGGYMICESVSAANAEFIVQAANEYRPMLEQLAIVGRRVRELEAQNAEMYQLIERFGTTVTDMFEQMTKGNWKDDQDHDVCLNAAMMAMRQPVIDAIKLREKLAGAV